MHLFTVKNSKCKIEQSVFCVCSDCCCHWTGRVFLQKHETILQVHISESNNRSTWKRNMEKGLNGWNLSNNKHLNHLCSDFCFVIDAAWKIWTNSRISKELEKHSFLWTDPYVTEITFIARRWTTSTVYHIFDLESFVPKHNLVCVIDTGFHCEKCGQRIVKAANHRCHGHNTAQFKQLKYGLLSHNSQRIRGDCHFRHTIIYGAAACK